VVSGAQHGTENNGQQKKDKVNRMRKEVRKELVQPRASRNAAGDELRYPEMSPIGSHRLFHDSRRQADPRAGILPKRKGTRSGGGK